LLNLRRLSGGRAVAVVSADHAEALRIATSRAVAPIPAAKPDASRRCGERLATQIRIAAAMGRTSRPILRPVIKLKLVRKPAAVQARNHQLLVVGSIRV
jgi:hypothetical protein